MPTTRFTATIGIDPGYPGDGRPADVSPTGLSSAAAQGRASLVDVSRLAGAFAALWVHHAEAAAAEHGVEPSAVVSPALVAYPPRFGCTVGGEPVIQLTGNYNPAWRVGTADQWRSAVLYVLRRLAEHCGQTTFQVAFDQVDLVYFHTDPPGDGDDPRRG
mgnify:CR=1 FL=1